MRHKYSSRRHRGGSSNSEQAPAPSPSSYSSAATYGLAVNGSGNSQFDRVFDQKGSDGSFQSNSIIGLQGQRAGKRLRKSRGKRGGVWGQVINQAIVPFGLVAAQNMYGTKKRRGGKSSRKSRGGKKSHRRH